MATDRITGVVLAAGRSSRLGTPKQLLPYRDTTVLGATLDAVRGCGFDQLIVTLGGALDGVRQSVPLDDVQTVVVDDYRAGCSSSLRVALAHVDPEAAGLVLMLGDQPTVSVTAVATLLAQRGRAALAVCRYDDGIGHPFWLSREVFGDVARLHGDKAVWKLLDRSRAEHPASVREVRVGGTVPLDVDTWDDYQRLLASAVP